MDRLAELLLPWEFSPLIALVCAAAAGLYLLGLYRGATPGGWRVAGFTAGLLLLYGVTQTRFDYYSQYLFFAHRGQHLVLHHLAPFVIALSAPGAVLAAALPQRTFGMPRIRVMLRSLYRALQQPWIAGVLFVGLIAFWLVPAIHFDAMLNGRLYWLMNWTMALDGLLFWSLVFARNPQGLTPHLPFTSRIVLLGAVIPPQVLIGATIAFGDRPLFGIYDVCGRPFPITPMSDQQLGGLITWMPAVMMSVAGILILLAEHLTARAADDKEETRAKRQWKQDDWKQDWKQDTHNPT